LNQRGNLQAPQLTQQQPSHHTEVAPALLDPAVEVAGVAAAVEAPGSRLSKGVWPKLTEIKDNIKRACLILHRSGDGRCTWSQKVVTCTGREALDFFGQLYTSATTAQGTCMTQHEIVRY
jgi:hypothetical protein